MAILKFKSNGKWESIAAFQGEPGKDGAIQYTAGKGINIENDTISAEVDKQYVDEAIAGIEIPEGDGGNTNVKGHYYLKIKPYITPPDGGYGEYGTITTVGTATLKYSWREEINTICAGAYQDVIDGVQPILHLLFNFQPGNPNMQRYQYIAMEMDYINPNDYAEGNGIIFRHTMTTDNTIYRHSITVKGTLVDGVYTLSDATYACEKDVYLATDNTTAFTPTGDYNPATKKYVDDAVANAGTGAETGFVLNGSPVFKISCSYIHRLEVGRTYGGYINADDAIAMYKYCVENGVEYPAINLLMNSSNAQFTGIGVARTKVVDITGSSAMIDIYGLSSSDPNKYWYMDLRISCSADGNYTMSTSTSIKFSEYVGATKTYVDNAIKTSITSTLESDY